MTIGTECPHCESVFQVAAELVGKSMRCPNPTCREVFTVIGESSAPVVPPPPPPPPVSETGHNYVPVVDAERIDPPIPVIDGEPITVEVYNTDPVFTPVEVYEAERVPDPVPVAAPLPRTPKAVPAPPPTPTRTPQAAPVSPPPPARAPQVIDWAAEQESPARSDRSARGSRSEQDDDSNIPIRSRTRGTGISGKVILIALSVLVLLTAAGTVTFLLLGKMRGEEQEATAAEALYKEGKFAEAKRKYDSLAADYPDSRDLPRYKFFTALSQTQADASSVTVKDDPGLAQQSLAALLAEHGDSPLAQPNTGFGADVVVVGMKVCAAVGDHAADQVKKFQSKRSEVQLLDQADKAIADGRALLPILEKYRDKSGLTLDDVRKKFDDTEQSVQKERDRLAALAPWRNLADDPTDLRIDQFEKAMKAVGLERDAEAMTLATGAKTALRKRVVFIQDAKVAGHPPLETATTLTVTPRVWGTPDVRQVAGPQDVVFGIAHGVLYALDSRNGTKLWSERVSAESRTTDAPLRVKLADGATDWVLVPSVRAGQPALTARNTLDGLIAWHQPLPAPMLGKPVRVGDRLIVALSDALGTLLYLNLTDGTQLGRNELGQPVGGGISGLRGTNYGHGFVVVPADARRLFVFEVGKLGEDGKRQPPQVVRVFATNHPRDSLHGAPLLLDPEDANQARRVILAQSDGPNEMKLRSFPIPPPAELANASPEGDTRPDQIAEASVVGWSWFPPVSDGERIAVCTDKGLFAAFGMNLPGQADKPLYALPGQLADPDPAAVSRCQVVMMDDDSFWVILNGKLNRLRVSSNPRDGQKILPSMENRFVGEAVAAPQVRLEDGLAFITTKATDTGTIHLQAFDLNTGEERWRRQLGAIAVGPLVPLADGGQLLVDECGGIYRTNRDNAELTPLEKCEPKPGCVSPATSAVSTDGQSVWVAVQSSTTDGVKLSVRVIRNGKLDGAEKTVSIPAPLSGNAVALGDQMVFPLANKFLYRLGLKDSEVTQGPAWAGPSVKAGAVCHLTATSDGQLLFSDGGSQVSRRKWSPDKPEAEKTGGPWGSPSAVTSAPVVVSDAGKEWVLVADGGGVAVFDPNKPTVDPVRRWHGAAQGDIPVGRASSLVAVNNKVCWAAGGYTVVMAAPDQDKPAWMFPMPVDAGEVIGISMIPNGILVTGSSGVVVELSETGEVKAQASSSVGGPQATRAALLVGEQEVYFPLSDGTVNRLTKQKR